MPHSSSAVRDFREKETKYREALDRIARFDEAFYSVVRPERDGNLFGAALAETLANYARKVLKELQ